MSDEIAIREAGESDVEKITEVTLEAYAEYGKLMPEDIFKGYMDNIKRTIAGEDGPVQRLVAERGGEIVGSVLILPAGMTVEESDGTTYTYENTEVRLLAVLPAMRGQGIGEALMNECVRRVREAGQVKLALHSVSFMVPAQKLYQKMGFVYLPEHDEPVGEDVKVFAYMLNLAE